MFFFNWVHGRLVRFFRKDVVYNVSTISAEIPHPYGWGVKNLTFLFFIFVQKDCCA